MNSDSSTRVNVNEGAAQAIAQVGDSRVHVVGPSESKGLTLVVPRNPVRFLSITNSELDQYVVLAKGAADAQSFCLFTAGILVSAGMAIAAAPEVPAGHVFSFWDVVVPALFVGGLLATIEAGLRWRRESKAALKKQKELMLELSPGGS